MSSISVSAVKANVMTGNSGRGNVGESSSTFRAKDPISALTHFIAFGAAIMATPMIIIKCALSGGGLPDMAGVAVYMISMVLLYAASSSYHGLDISPGANIVLKKLDHVSISLLIAGSYTPFCISLLSPGEGMRLLVNIWALAAAGMIFKLFWVGCPRWISSVIYISMGWLSLLHLPSLYARMSVYGFIMLVAGGVLYTVGGVVYAMKFKVFGDRIPGFGSHELFHVFVMAGSLCHYLSVMSIFS